MRRGNRNRLPYVCRSVDGLGCTACVLGVHAVVGFEVHYHGHAGRLERNIRGSRTGSSDTTKVVLRGFRVPVFWGATKGLVWKGGVRLDDLLVGRGSGRVSAVRYHEY